MRSYQYSIASLCTVVFYRKIVCHKWWDRRCYFLVCLEYISLELFCLLILWDIWSPVRCFTWWIALRCCWITFLSLLFDEITRSYCWYVCRYLGFRNEHNHIVHITYYLTYYLYITHTYYHIALFTLPLRSGSTNQQLFVSLLITLTAVVLTLIYLFIIFIYSVNFRQDVLPLIGKVIASPPV